MTSLVEFEQTLLKRYRELEARAEKIHTVKEAEVDELDAEAFVEKSVLEVIENAEKEEQRLPIVPPDDCEVADNVNATVRLLRVKSHDLETRLHSTLDTLRTADAQLQETRRELDERQTTIDKQKDQIKKLNIQTEQLTNEHTNTQTTLQACKREIRELKSKLTDYEKEKRQLEAMTKTKDIRQKRMTEEIERCKSAMESFRIRDRDTRDSAKKDLDNIQAENKKLERQKSELVVALRKQMKLIDVLKRQKAHIEASKLLSFTEEEFERVITLHNDESKAI